MASEALTDMQKQSGLDHAPALRPCPLSIAAVLEFKL